ncbi:hypothetical protein [Aestuariivivens insulae]|uniref:hypothetical protein n=1 Tax=Aestuariivivens insulae TaxID=1621988 RepID=UPI001F5A11C1|nr:hypothetical protein [Aestuariivivens insulae]
MKPLNPFFSRSYISLRLSRKQSVFISTFLILTILCFSISCSYYNVRNVATTQEEISTGVNEFNKADKYVILHFDALQWHISDMVISEDDQTIKGTLKPVSKEHQFVGKKTINRTKKSKKSNDTLSQNLSTRDSKRTHRYNPKKLQPLNEVHFYLKNNYNYENYQMVSIPLSEINRISVNDKNTGRAVANVLLGTVGTIFVAALLYAALKSSCPFVYVKNGEEYYFIGELYPGTITPNMQKDDYLQLPPCELENDEYVLKITNYLKEIQYTDVVQLVRFIHDEDVEVLLDSQGKLQTFKNIIAPREVTLDDGLKSIEPALEKDGDFYAFNTTLKTENSTRHIVLDFAKPNHAKQMKLYLTTKNSVWLDYAFGKFNEQFGQYYNTFQKKQQKVSNDSIRAWANKQHIPLSVYLKTTNGWKLIERISTVGPMAMRDLVVPIPLNEVVQGNVQIKLETGFMFWEVDYVGMDFSENVDLTPEYISPYEAIDQNGEEVTKLITKHDQNYLVQPNIGDEVTVTFKVKEPKPESKQSFFLKNRGYYNYIRDYKGIPDFETLKSFKKDHAFTQFSEKRYFDFVNFNVNELAYYE